LRAAEKYRRGRVRLQLTTARAQLDSFARSLCKLHAHARARSYSYPSTCVDDNRPVEHVNQVLDCRHGMS
jgi:hypothetical protein